MVDPKVKELLKEIRTIMGNLVMPDQRSAQEQVQELIFIGNQLGLYDAVGVIDTVVAKKPA